MILKHIIRKDYMRMLVMVNRSLFHLYIKKIKDWIAHKIYYYMLMDLMGQQMIPISAARGSVYWTEVLSLP